MNIGHTVSRPSNSKHSYGMRPSAWQQRVGLTTVNYSSSASRLATALLDPCMLLFLPVARLTPASALLQLRLTTEKPYQCPMPPCCKAHRCKASSVLYASLLQGLLPGPCIVWSGLCFIPLASAAHPTRGPNALERRGLWSGLVCVLYTTVITFNQGILPDILPILE